MKITSKKGGWRSHLFIFGTDDLHTLARVTIGWKTSPNFSCSIGYMRSLFHLHKSLMMGYAELGTWNIHTTTTYSKTASGFLFAKRVQVSEHEVTSCWVLALLVQSTASRLGRVS